LTAPMPPAAAPASDKTTLWGVLGIVVGLLCCWPLGVVFGILSMNEAKRVGKPNTLAILAFVASAINLIFGVVYWTQIRR
jgi:putative Ca2+/H+ antiporter (TMEM165/GDT1 family)